MVIKEGVKEVIKGVIKDVIKEGVKEGVKGVIKEEHQQHHQHYLFWRSRVDAGREWLVILYFLFYLFSSIILNSFILNQY